jgi:serine/threonine protein kinase
MWFTPCAAPPAGLAYLHALRTIHRDIKCANLLLDKDGIIKLADLGMAKQLVEAVSVTQSFKGSAFWMVRRVVAGRAACGAGPNKHDAAASEPVCRWLKPACTLQACRMLL